jgi:putative effector of murein hydrolase LrgA (UPF0299 family)
MNAQDAELFQTFKTFFGYSYATAVVQSQMAVTKTQLIPVTFVIIIIIKIVSILQTHISSANITIPYITKYFADMFRLSRQLLVQLLVSVLAPWTQSLLHDTLFGSIISVWILYTLVYIADNAINHH